jgi:hypothetical protein
MSDCLQEALPVLSLAGIVCARLDLLGRVSNGYAVPYYTKEVKVIVVVADGSHTFHGEALQFC